MGNRSIQANIHNHIVPNPILNVNVPPAYSPDLLYKAKGKPTKGDSRIMALGRVCGGRTRLLPLHFARLSQNVTPSKFPWESCDPRVSPFSRVGDESLKNVSISAGTRIGPPSQRPLST